MSIATAAEPFWADAVPAPTDGQRIGVLLTEKPQPTDADIDAAMSGNLCRCATYRRIRRAIKTAAGMTVAEEA